MEAGGAATEDWRSRPEGIGRSAGAPGESYLRAVSYERGKPVPETVFDDVWFTGLCDIVSGGANGELWDCAPPSTL